MEHDRAQCHPAIKRTVLVERKKGKKKIMLILPVNTEISHEPHLQQPEIWWLVAGERGMRKSRN